MEQWKAAKKNVINTHGWLVTLGMSSIHIAG